MDGVDRLVLLINQTSIVGRTRLQKYGFLAHQLYRTDLEPLGFYSDWEAYHYGPYSVDLACDLRDAEKAGLVKTERTDPGSRDADLYSLGPKGRKRLSSMLGDHGDLINRIHETFANFNKKPLPVLVKEICADYPKYAVNGKIKDRAAARGRDDGVRFNPKIEHMLEEIASGNANWEVHTPQEHIAYVERLVND